MPVPALPPELWRAILDYALPLDEELLLEPSIIGPFEESSWYEMVFGEFWLRRPQESLRARQRQGYGTKKVSHYLLCICSTIVLKRWIERHANQCNVVTSWN